MKKYLSIIRINHWTKQIFMLPGIVAALVLIKDAPPVMVIVKNIIRGFLSISLVASSNYAINEWLDAKTDTFHPVKKDRSAVVNQLNANKVYLLYVVLAVLGILTGLAISKQFAIVAFCMWVMGILYNVKPFRLKDIAYIDVLSESINSAIRFLAGWFIVTKDFLPPVSIVLGYWFAGAFLMAAKRIAELRTINDYQVAAMYRKSFNKSSEKSLMITAFFYAMVSVMFIGVFLIKYRIELILFMPFFIGLFCYYVYISFKEDSAAQSPEKLYKEKGLMLYLALLCAVFILLMIIDIPVLHELLSDTLIIIN